MNPAREVKTPRPEGKTTAPPHEEVQKTLRFDRRLPHDRLGVEHC
jgi:hypothetical protein